MPPLRPAILATLLLLILIAPDGARTARADSVALGSSRDNTLFEDAQGQRSNGAGQYLFAGRSDEVTDQLRRGLVAFDVASAVPAGSTIYRVMLVLHMSRSALAGTEALELRRVLADWGEGASDSAVLGGGMGAPAAAGDATWIHTFFPTPTWSSAGGDFMGTASATAEVGGPGSYVWRSTAAMVADAQTWLDDPPANFGWALVGNEATNATAKRFDTKEHVDPDHRPVLIVDFAAPGDGAVVGTKFRDLDADGITAGDPPLAGVRIDLFLDDGDGVFEPEADDALVDTATTAADGSYGFAASPGAYFIAEDPADLAAQSLTQTDGGDDFAGGIPYYMVTITAATVSTDRDFGNFRPAICGDGIVDIGEACDDGNVAVGDCCSSECEPEASGSPCAEDGDACTNNICDGAGTCTHPAAPQSGCRAPAEPLKAQLVLKDPLDGSRDRLTWKWIKGQATSVADFGDPLAVDDYALCIYGGQPGLPLRAQVPAGGTCAGKPCWREAGASGFKYREKAGTGRGLQRILLKAGEAGKAKVLVKGRGESLPDPPLPFTLPITVQLRSTNGQCWEAEYFEAGASRNEPGSFKGKAGVP
jgi:cysteine-rich repeat protein